MYDFLVIHGSYGSPYKNWFPWVHSALAKRGKTCLNPHFPTPEGQNYETWSKLLKFYVDEGFVGENTTIITHSMSCVFVARFCVDNNMKIKKFVSVSGFNEIDYSPTDSNDIYNSFYASKEELAKFKGLCEERYAFYSDNDPYVPIEKGKEFADIIGAEHLFREGCGHFNLENKEMDFAKFREILEVLV